MHEDMYNQKEKNVCMYVQTSQSNCNAQVTFSVKEMHITELEVNQWMTPRPFLSNNLLSIMMGYSAL